VPCLEVIPFVPEAIIRDVFNGGGYALTATSAADSLAHIITITGNAATNHSAKTFTITGTDADGIAQTEAIAGPNGAVAVSSTKYFKTVTAVTVSATTGADTFDIGWTGVSVSAAYVMDWQQNAFQASLGLAITGTISVTVQHCFENVMSASPSTRTWWPHSSLVTKTASADGNYAFPVSATRLLINSVTAGATVNLFILQGFPGV